MGDPTDIIHLLPYHLAFVFRITVWACISMIIFATMFFCAKRRKIRPLSARSLMLLELVSIFCWMGTTATLWEPFFIEYFEASCIAVLFVHMYFLFGFVFSLMFMAFRIWFVWNLHLEMLKSTSKGQFFAAIRRVVFGKKVIAMVLLISLCCCFPILIAHGMNSLYGRRLCLVSALPRSLSLHR